MDSKKIEHSTKLIRESIAGAQRPAMMSSFGKDSMVLAHLIKGDSVHFPMDVIYLRDPWMPHKNMFADKTARSWGMAVHDYPPMNAGVKVKPDMLELVSRYSFGNGVLDIPKNVCQPSEYPRRDFICGLNDWVLRPKAVAMTPWDVVFHGHKSSDVDPFEGKVPLRADTETIGGVKVVFPLRDWSDKDLWEYIENDGHIPVQETRYKNRREVDDKWHINDYVHACTACIDPRNMSEMVFCPKQKKEVKNRGQEVLQLNVRPDYIGEQHAT